MRVTCSQDSLHKALAVAGRAVATKSTLPVLGNFLLEAADDVLTISATNLEFGISVAVPATVAQAGRTTLQARVLSDFVANLPAGDVELAEDSNPLQTLVRSGQSQAHLRGIDPDDFPRLISSVDGGQQLHIDPALLRESIAHVVFAAASDDSRPVLAGVQLDVRDGMLGLSAADGFRMSLRSVALVDGPGDPMTIIVPARALQELSRVLGDVSAPVSIQVTPNQSQLLATADGVRFTTRLIDGAFPDLKQVVPKQWNTRTVVRRELLLDATKRASIFARTNNDVIRLAMAPAEDGFEMGRLTITANAADTGDNQDDVDASVEGGEVQIAFNGRYLADVLGVMRGSEVAFELMGSNSAGVIRSVDNDDFTHVIMPMVIGSN